MVIACRLVTWVARMPCPVAVVTLEKTSPPPTEPAILGREGTQVIPSSRQSSLPVRRSVATTVASLRSITATPSEMPHSVPSPFQRRAPAA